MSIYYNAAGELREIDDALMAAWVAAGNPKADGWQLQPPAPAHDPTLQTIRWDGAAWIVDARPVPEVQAAIGAAVQAVIDDVCRGGVPYFRDIFSARGYVGDPNPAYHARAVLLRDWSSAIWTTLDEIEADVLAGNRPFPTIDQLFSELPEPPA